MHISFNVKIIQYALDHFPLAYSLNGDKENNKKIGNYSYKDSVYKELGL